MTLQRGTPEIKPPATSRGEPASALGLPIPPKPERTIPRSVMIMWLVVIGMAVFFLPLYLVALTVREDAKNMETEIASIRVSLTNVPTPPPEIASQLTPLAQAQRQINQIYQVYPTLVAPHPDLPAIMTAINNYSPYEITLTNLTLADRRITLNGRAARDEYVLTYVRNLEQSNLFSRVTLESAQVVATITPTLTITPTMTALPTASPTIALPTITLAPTITSIPATSTPSLTPTSTPSPTPSNTPTVTPTGTATATSTPSPTPDLRDVYEPDEPEPKPIAVGETQQHNFYPAGDNDYVKFPAKAQRFYQVLTSDLALGVDTVVTVRLGSNSWSNDDYSPGSGNFASAVCFQAPQDGTAVTTIVNKAGFYGPDKIYKIKVSEVPNLNAPPCPGATATPGAMQMPRLVLASASYSPPENYYSSLVFSQLTSPISNPANPRAGLAPMPYRFMIILDLKVTTP